MQLCVCVRVWVRGGGGAGDRDVIKNNTENSLCCIRDYVLQLYFIQVCVCVCVCVCGGGGGGEGDGLRCDGSCYLEM